MVIDSKKDLKKIDDRNANIRYEIFMNTSFKSIEKKADEEGKNKKLTDFLGF